MTRRSDPKWPCCRRTSSIDRTHPGSSDLDHPSLHSSLLPPFLPHSLYLCRHSICQLRARKADFGIRREGGREGAVTSSRRRERTRVVLARRLLNFLPPSRSFRTCCLFPTVSCTVRGRRPERCAQCKSKSPRRLEGSDGWRECTILVTSN